MNLSYDLFPENNISQLGIMLWNFVGQLYYLDLNFSDLLVFSRTILICCSIIHAYLKADYVGTIMSYLHSYCDAFLVVKNSSENHTVKFCNSAFLSFVKQTTFISISLLQIPKTRKQPVAIQTNYYIMHASEDHYRHSLIGKQNDMHKW